MQYTFYTFSFGCRINEAEMQVVNRQMIEAGFTFSEAKPDIYIINTCAVTQKAEREARQLIFQIRKKFPNTYIIITGCSATFWRKNNIYSNLPANLIIENTNKENLVNLLLIKFLVNDEIASPSRRDVGIPRNDIKNNCNNLLINRPDCTGITNKYTNSGRYLVKIQVGCQRFCSYCIVPYLRGKPKSERIKNILKLVSYLQSLSLRGSRISERRSNLQEVILTAINTEAFGVDTGESFVDLLKAIIDKTNIPRISMGSINPWSDNNEFIKFYKEYKDKKRLVDFFHIPIQSGSNNILKLMKRDYTREEFMEKVQSIELINKMAFIATDVIVGFLGETDKDFDDTYEFLEKSPISKFHVFRYSSRPKTAAWYMKKSFMEPNSQVKAIRSKALIDLGKIKYQKFLEKHLNRTFSTLVLEKKINGYHEALLSNQIPIFVKINKKNIANILNVKIIEQKKDKLFGKMV
jgi:threonylcarbamoyladenosine tRNA methylthiotransferase MtaB